MFTDREKLRFTGLFEVGGQCRTRTCDLLLVSTAFTKNQHFSTLWMYSDSLVKMRVCATPPNLELKPSKRPLGTKLGTPSDLTPQRGGEQGTVFGNLYTQLALEPESEMEIGKADAMTTNCQRFPTDTEIISIIPVDSQESKPAGVTLTVSAISYGAVSPGLSLFAGPPHSHLWGRTADGIGARPIRSCTPGKLPSNGGFECNRLITEVRRNCLRLDAKESRLDSVPFPDPQLNQQAGGCDVHRTAAPC